MENLNIAPKKVVKVVVLGDIGRSPRMQYHALSLASAGLEVNILGYVDSQPLPEILANKNIIITELYPFKIDHGPQLLQYALKAIWQFISLFLTLLVTGKCDFLLCQNPPAIPTLPACWLYCLVTRTKFVIDWHNYAYSIMALSLRSNHPLLKVSTVVEKQFGRRAAYNICVTYAMKIDLIENWNIRATVLYDRPPHIFKPISLLEKHLWFQKLSQLYPEFNPTGRDSLNFPERSKTMFTLDVNGKVQLRTDRPGLLFSSTSWTQDEDFFVLLESLQVYETTYDLTKTLPKLICVITGKGPLKDHYIKSIADRNWRNVKVVTPWLEAADYPKMVASADLGVCLHTSSSGLDLPMKVVDMFGAGLPVCAYEFKCLGELVKNNINGYTFKNSDELSKQIVEWFQNFPNNAEMNATSERMKEELKKFQELRWEENWDRRIKPYFTS